MFRLAAAALLLSACHAPDYLSYDWDQRQVLCSDSIDNLSENVHWDLVDDQLREAQVSERVVLFHAHVPGVTVSVDKLAHVLELADKYQLTYYTYNQLVPGPSHAGLALALDDDNVASWLSIRDLLNEHHAHITFFITRYYNMDADTRAGLLTLQADGHDLEPHTVHHLHARDYVDEHGLDAYMTDEVLPSIQDMEEAGFSIDTFAYPFGEHTDAMDNEILKYVGKVRTTPGECPY